jgi:hypothetical protein
LDRSIAKITPPAAAHSVIQPDTQRSLKLPAGSAKPQQNVSATAKTHDLKIAAKAALPQASSVIKVGKTAARERIAAAVSSIREVIATVQTTRSTAAATLGNKSNQLQSISAANGSTRPAASQVPLIPTQKPADNSSRQVAGAWLSSEGTRFGLNGVRIVIGRVEGGAQDGIDIDLSQLRRSAERVSHRHAEIIKQGADYFLRDLGSLNGTYVAGRGRLGRDQLYRLRDRDEIVLGGAKLEFRRK